MKKLIYLMTFTGVVATNAYAVSSYATYICLRNATNVNQYITVGSIDNNDWDGDSRPDHNFNNVTLAPGQIDCQREEINAIISGDYANFDFYIYGIDIRMTTRDNSHWSFNHSNKFANNNDLCSNDKLDCSGFDITY